MRCALVGVVAAMLASSVGRAQGSFEGVVTYQITSGSGKNMMIDYYVKGGKARIQPHDSTASAGGMFGGMIIDSDNKTRTMIVPSRKMYVTAPITENSEQHMDSAMHDAKMTKIGSEVVAGVTCDVYATKDAKTDKSGTVCIAHGMGNFAMIGMGSPLARLEAHVQGLSAAAQGGLFPLKMTSQTDSMIATKVDKKSLDPSLFAPPAGYTQMQVPAGARNQ